MPDVALKRLDTPPTPDGYEYFNMVVFGTDGPLPPKPTPPGEKPDGIWGPDDPRPSNPIQLPPWVGKPQPPFPGSGDVKATGALIAWPKEGSEVPATPPDVSALKPLLVFHEKGAPPMVAYAMPYVSTGPV